MTWPPSWIAMVYRGLLSQASPNELREFLSISFSLFNGFTGFILSYAQEQRVKTPRRKAILRGKFQQLERQHNPQKGSLLPSFLPGGGTQQTFIREGTDPRFNLVPFYIPIFTKKLPLFYTFYWQMVHLSHKYTLLRTLHSFSLL